MKISILLVKTAVNSGNRTRMGGIDRVIRITISSSNYHYQRFQIMINYCCIRLSRANAMNATRPACASSESNWTTADIIISPWKTIKAPTVSMSRSTLKVHHPLLPSSATLFHPLPPSSTFLLQLTWCITDNHSGQVHNLFIETTPPANYQPSKILPNDQIITQSHYTAVKSNLKSDSIPNRNDLLSIQLSNVRL